MALTQNPPLGLYVHFPWCEKKCPYCDFNSHQNLQIPEEEYIEALLQDLEQELPLFWGRQVETVFFGGGTPSLFSGESIEYFLSQLRAYLNLGPQVEITIESNPGSAQLEKYRAYRQAGINRLSIGAQSFNDQHLRSLGRIHNAQQVLSAFHAAREAGFDNINLDVMFALPGQTLQQSLSDVQYAIDLQPEHISFYQLTIEPNTYFATHIPANLPLGDLAFEMSEQGAKLLCENGYPQYEVSAYSQKACQHNMNYWQFGDYLGIGAGAIGKISLAAENKVIRRCRHRDPKKYMQSVGEQKISSQTVLSDADLIFEFMLNATRLKNGFPLSLMAQTTGLSTALVWESLQKLKSKGYISFDQEYIKPTDIGFRFLNDVQSEFLELDLKKIPSNSVNLYTDEKA